MGCPDALVDRAKLDLSIQCCIPLLCESLEFIRSDPFTMILLEAWNFKEDSVFVDCPRVPKSTFSRTKSRCGRMHLSRTADSKKKCFSIALE